VFTRTFWTGARHRGDYFFPQPSLCIYTHTRTHICICIYIVSSRVPTNHHHRCRHLCHPSDIAVGAAVCIHTHKSNRFIYFREKYRLRLRLGFCDVHSIGRDFVLLTLNSLKTCNYCNYNEFCYIKTLNFSTSFVYR